MILPPLPDLLLLLALGLALGSFLNVCIARLPLHRSIVRPGSRCPRCEAPIRARDNVPILSWLLLRGRCRSCALPISVRYPLVEAAYAGLVLASVAKFGFSAKALGAAIFCFFTLGLLVTDLLLLLLPDSLTAPGALLGVFFALMHVSVSEPGVSRGGSPALRIAAGLGWALGLLAVRWSYYAVRRRHGMGAGDVKLAAMLALWLGGAGMGVACLVGVCGAALVGALGGLLDASGSGKSASSANARPWRLRELPFGAFLCGGALYSLFFGPQVLKWYFSFFP